MMRPFLTSIDVQKNKCAIFALTANGVQLARGIAKELPGADLYFSKRHVKEGEKSYSSFTQALQQAFKEYDQIICIMATGIVIRSIAPVIEHKSKDPAIVILDERAQFAISLLSGHLGGANELTQTLADITGAQPVITTASDVQKKIAVDSLAMRYQLQIESLCDAKKVTASLVDNHDVELINHTELVMEDEVYKIYKGDSSSKCRILISRKKEESDKITAWLYPKDIVLGVGAKRNVDSEHFAKKIDQQLKVCNIDPRCVKEVVSVDLKSDEEAIIEYAKKIDVPFRVFSVEELKKVDHLFEGSPFVKKTIGVSSVSETSAYLASNYGEKILGKTKLDGLTLSIYREEIWEK